MHSNMPPLVIGCFIKKDNISLLWIVHPVKVVIKVSLPVPSVYRTSPTGESFYSVYLFAILLDYGTTLKSKLYCLPVSLSQPLFQERVVSNHSLYYLSIIALENIKQPQKRLLMQGKSRCFP
jgi:hypothetical protein